jgi:hypothetical protein
VELHDGVSAHLSHGFERLNVQSTNKLLFAGGLLGAFLLQLWWPFWSQNTALPERKP